MSLIRNFVPGFSFNNGFKFSNRDWPKEPLFYLNNVVLPLPPPGIGIGDASKGLCGGMVFAARDYFQIHKLPPADNQNPPQGSDLFNFIVQRLIDSFGLAQDHVYQPPLSTISAIKYWELMQPALPDHEVDIELLGHGRAWRMIKEEWPKIKADIDMHNPSPIGLVLVKSMNLSDMRHHHQVLAYGYELFGSGLVMYVYDPNWPDRNGTISLNISDPIHTTNVYYSPPLVNGEKIWSFFRIDEYFFRDPTLRYPDPIKFPHPATPVPIPQICQPIADSIKELKSELQEMQDELNTPPFPTAGQRSAIANRIKQINNQIAQKQKDLDLCVQQHSG